MHYPEAARANNISGDVFVSFMVDEAGRLLDAEVVKGVGYGLDEEALRLVRLMPWWTPGLVAGKPVKVPATLRIRFGGIVPDPAGK
ncbi:energy transducer TonB [Hymenobacter sp. BRD67]|uniref:energy transducer TonB n=1 Tax=Hymenobacter sp. BRD67 TaxID=2675877 RepID=UPI0015639C2F|nr:energy transducer TonB [Hymenobacter sp. BRD67]QKG52903.1 energy transducer TonB [Hymenobacter sp. BRD67]